MKKDMISVSLKLPLVLVSLIAVAISGTNSLLFHYTSGIDGSLSQIAFGASSSDSIFGDVPASTDSDDSNADDSNSGNTKQGDSDNNKDDDDKTSKPVDEDQTEEEAAATSSGSNVAPQAQGGSSGTEDDASSSANTSSSSLTTTKNVSITGVKQDKSYDPNPIEINAGESVTWTNDDNEIHDVASGSPEKENMGQEFASGILSSGKSFSHTFDKPGTYEYFCTFHEAMTGEVVVK